MIILSLGAGVQSTAMALMAAAGEIAPMPDAAIFADTQWEPRAVYAHLDWLERQLPFPVYRVTAGNLRAALVAHVNSTGQRFSAVPWHMKNPDGSTAMGRRQCTKEYKIIPIRQKSRALMTAAGHRTVEQWIGISTDEAVRMKPSNRKYITHRWPLVELGMSRWDCLRWMERRGFQQPPKSACIGCPFHDNAAWRRLRESPEEWADAVEVDKAIRHQPKFKNEQYMHRSLVPLDQVDLSTAEDRGQLNMFNNECEGMCGV